jgi:hypothetical protein
MTAGQVLFLTWIVITGGSGVVLAFCYLVVRIGAWWAWR